jgi:hypothetical protein
MENIDECDEQEEDSIISMTMDKRQHYNASRPSSIIKNYNFENFYTPHAGSRRTPQDSNQL